MDNSQLKTFWDRKEGLWGYGIIACFALVALFVGKAIMPTVIDVLTMTNVALGQLWSAVALAGSLGILMWIMFATNVPKMFAFGFKVAVRWFASKFTTIFPIEIMDEFISKMKLKQAQFKEKKTEIRQQQRLLEDTIKQNEKERTDALARVSAAQKRGMEMEITLNARQAGRLEELNTRHKASLQTVTMLGQRLTRVEELINFKILDMEDQKRALKQEFEISKKTKSAIAAAKAILHGADPDQEMYDMAVEFVIEDSRLTMGLVDDFMEGTKSMLDGFDLQNGMWEEKALAQIAKLEETEKVLIGRSPQSQALQQQLPPTMDAQIVHVLPSTDHSKYFN